MTIMQNGFKLADDEGYMLDHNYNAACRLNLQYYLWKESLHFNLHPSIKLPPENIRIADLATGTAIWLANLSRELPPTAVLDGFDINISSAPPPEWLPSNVFLHTQDIFGSLPPEFIGKFDVVHLRLMILVVEKNDPSPIIQQAYHMLKPGGYIQWDDLNYPDTHVVRASPDMEDSSVAFNKLRTFVYSEGRHDWVLDLPKFMCDNGFEEAQMYHYHDRDELYKANGDQHLWTMTEFAGKLAQTGKIEEAEAIRLLVRDVSMDAAKGLALTMPRAVCVARRMRI